MKVHNSFNGTTKNNWDVVTYHNLNLCGLSPRIKQQRFFFMIFKCASLILFFNSEYWLWCYRQYVDSIYVIHTILTLIYKSIICHSSYTKPERISCLSFEKPSSLMSYLYSIDRGHSLPGTMDICKLSEAQGV